MIQAIMANLGSEDRSSSHTPRRKNYMTSMSYHVCVGNIWRVKLLTRVFFTGFQPDLADLISCLLQFQNRFSFSAGGLEPICLSSPTKLWHFGGWVVWSTTCTCISWHGCRGHSLQDHFDNLIYFHWWHPAKPRTGTTFFKQFLKRFSHQTTVRFSQSDWAASELVEPSSKDVERLLRTISHVGSTKISCLVLLKCFCTHDAFHINNSIRFFWASVCVHEFQWLTLDLAIPFPIISQFSSTGWCAGTVAAMQA